MHANTPCVCIRTTRVSQGAQTDGGGRAQFSEYGLRRDGIQRGKKASGILVWDEIVEVVRVGLGRVCLSGVGLAGVGLGEERWSGRSRQSGAGVVGLVKGGVLRS